MLHEEQAYTANKRDLLLQYACHKTLLVVTARFTAGFLQTTWAAKFHKAIEVSRAQVKSIFPPRQFFFQLLDFHFRLVTI